MGVVPDRRNLVSCGSAVLFARYPITEVIGNVLAFELSCLEADFWAVVFVNWSWCGRGRGRVHFGAVDVDYDVLCTDSISGGGKECCECNCKFVHF